MMAWLNSAMLSIGIEGERWVQSDAQEAAVACGGGVQLFDEGAHCIECTKRWRLVASGAWHDLLPAQMRRSARTARLLTTMYDRLLGHHGPQGWWPGRRPVRDHRRRDTDAEHGVDERGPRHREPQGGGRDVAFGAARDTGGRVGRDSPPQRLLQREGAQAEGDGRVPGALRGQRGAVARHGAEDAARRAAGSARHRAGDGGTISCSTRRACRPS